MAIFKGAGVAIVTPMKENEEVNYDKLEELVEWQIEQGTDAIVIVGTTGELSLIHILTAADIDQYLKRNGDAVNITTIYRYLDKLATDGTVMKYVAEAGGKAVYQYVELGQHCEEHLHLKCVKCGCIIHLDCGFMDEIAEHIQKDHGFQLQCKNSILYGICKDCRRE